MIRWLRLIIIMFCISAVIGGCREQERNECESICRKNAENETYCELRAALILPNSPKIEASMPRVFPVIKLAEERIRRDEILPSNIKITWIPYDDKCDAAYATISAIDAYAKNCSHIIFGPSCEYAVSSVARVAKYFYADGLNIITAGGFAHNFEENKTTCNDEYHMLQRVGLLSFEKIAHFMIEVMKLYKWTTAAFFYERNGYSNIGGLQTCHLMMSSMAKFFRESNLTYSSFAMDSSNYNLTEDLKREVGLDHSTAISIASLFILHICNHEIELSFETTTESTWI